MDKVYQVFVSSTFTDLEDERKKVSDTLAKAGFIPSGMELFPATSLKQLEFIKRVIDRCDYYVVIVAARYGSLDGDKSFTEQEYEYAVSKGIPVLAFIHKNPGKIAAEKTESDPKQVKRLDKFRDRLKDSRIVHHWADINDLCTNVLLAVTSEVTLSPGVGWIRGDQAIDPKMLLELERLRVEAAELRQRLAQLAANDIVFPPNVIGPDEPFPCILNKKIYERQHAAQRPRLAETQHLPVAPVLRDVFVALFEAVLMQKPEWHLRGIAGEVIAKLEGQPTEKLVGYELDQDSLRNMRYQLDALGLIEAIGETRPDGQSEIYWTTTDKGRRYAALSLAKRKEPEA